MEVRGRCGRTIGVIINPDCTGALSQEAGIDLAVGDAGAYERGGRPESNPLNTVFSPPCDRSAKREGFLDVVATVFTSYPGVLNLVRLHVFGDVARVVLRDRECGDSERFALRWCRGGDLGNNV